MPYLEISTDCGQLRVRIADKPVTIGRDNSNKLPIREERASRQHCIILLTGEGYLLRDLGSKNGTKINGVRAEQAVLHDGDVFEVGKTRFVFHQGDPDDAAPMAAPAPAAVPAAQAVGQPPVANPPAAAALRPRAPTSPMPPAPPAPAPVNDDQPVIRLVPGKLIRGDSPEATGGAAARPAAAPVATPAATSPTPPAPAPHAAEPPPAGILEIGEIPEISAGFPATSPVLAGAPHPAAPQPAAASIPLEGESAVALPTPPPQRRAPAVDPLRGLDTTPLDDSGPTNPSAGKPAASVFEILNRLILAGQEQSIAEGDLVLISARGQTIHAAANVADGGKKTGEGIRLLRLLLVICIKTGASDVHVEPRQDEVGVRLRVDGTMVDALHLEKATGALLLGVVKVLGDIDIAQRSIIQEGHFTSKLRERRVDYRVSFTPTVFGQKLVIRVLDLANSPQRTADLQLPQWMYEQVRGVSRQDAGMLLVCGPTGSGKTTTLYAVLRDIDTRERNVVTIEDPVEYQLDGVTQIPIDDQHGNSFHNLLRSVLRQDPDVILLGEIRDKDTARTAMQAAMTGHLVLSTVHAKDTTGAMFRLLDLGVEPYLVASSLNLVLAQRLIRQLCPSCREERRPTPQQSMAMGRLIEGISKIYLPVGCPRCLGTGYSGRRGLFELLTVNDETRDVILQSPSINAIRNATKKMVFSSLRQSGYQMVAEGLTSITEVDRVTGTSD